MHRKDEFRGSIVLLFGDCCNFLIGLCIQLHKYVMFVHVHINSSFVMYKYLLLLLGLTCVLCYGRGKQRESRCNSPVLTKPVNKDGAYASWKIYKDL